MKQNQGMNILEIVDKVVEIFSRGRWLPMDSMDCENYFETYVHKIEGIGHIASDKPNPAYVVGSCYT